MKNIILGGIIGAGLIFGGTVLAKTVTTDTPMSVVDTLDVPRVATIYKIYDENANVVCYLTYTHANTWQPSTVSCLKNI